MKLQNIPFQKCLDQKIAIPGFNFFYKKPAKLSPYRLTSIRTLDNELPEK